MPRADEIQLRRDTTAHWTSVNPILADGEPGWDETAKVLKIGDGATHWTSLPVAADSEGSVTAETVRATAAEAALRTTFNVKDYGAVGNGTTNDTTAIQNALNAVPSTGGTLYFPPGTYLVPNGGIARSSMNNLHIRGAAGLPQSGTGASSIKVTADSVTALSITGPGTVVEYLSIYHDPTTSRSSSLIGLALTNCNFARVSNCVITGFSTNLKIATGVYYTVTNSAFRDFAVYGVDLSFSGSPDAGDPTIAQCHFDRTSADTATGGTAIRLSSIGGVRLSNNKVNGKVGSGGFDYGVLFEVPNGVTSTLMQMVGGSYEGIKTACAAFVFASGATTGSLLSLQITGVEFNGLNNASSVGVLVSGPTVTALSVTGCTFSLLDTNVDFKNCDKVAISGNTERGTITTKVNNRSGNTSVVTGMNSWDPVEMFVSKTADETITSTATLQDDDHLFWDISASATEIWYFEVILRYLPANTTMDFQVGLTAPAGATGVFGIQGAAGVAVNGWGVQTTASAPSGLAGTLGGPAVSGSTNNATQGQVLAGWVYGGGTAGRVHVQWAQNTSDAGALTVKKGSLLRLVRIAA